MCFESAPDYTGAANIQAQAANRAADLQWQMYQTGRQDLAPWRGAGGAGVNQIAGILGLPGYSPVDPTSTLQATPGYQWGLSQGTQALDRSAAARGQALSGPQRNAIQQFGQNYALQTAWQPYMSALQNLSGQGMGAAGQTANMGLQTGQAMGQDWMSAANAQAQAMIQQQIAQNQQSSGLFGGIGSLLGLGLSAFGGGGLGLGGMIGGGLSGLFGGGGGGGGWGNTMYGNSMSPDFMMAKGGPTEPDKPYIVGERGPELFVPRQAGFVVPNHALKRFGAANDWASAGALTGGGYAA